MPVSADARVLKNSLALRIVRRESTDFVVLTEPAQAHPRGAWRTGDLESDARVLFCREREEKLGDVVLLDGSRVRVHTDPEVEFEAPHEMSQIHLSGA